MEESNGVVSPNLTDPEPSYSPDKQFIVGVGVTIFLLVVGFVGYSILKGNFSGKPANKNVLSASTGQITPIQISPSPQNTTETATNITPATTNDISPVPNTKACAKNGPAQKWEYLTPYVVKDGDTLQSIAATQLNNVSRVNEILQLNGQGPYVVGSTIYLPPSTITQSSGNIKEVYGMLVKKDSSYWQLSYSADPKGLGVLIPSFWFDSLANVSTFTVGNCITVLFDDGNKVFSVALQ